MLFRIKSISMKADLSFLPKTMGVVMSSTIATQLTIVE